MSAEWTPVVPEPGDFGLVTTYGNLRGRLAALAIQYGTNSRRNHVVTCLGTNAAGVRLIGEAEPGGYRIGPASRYSADDVVWSTGRLPEHLVPTDAQREGIVRNCHGFEGTPYASLDIALIALAQKRLGTVIHPDVPISQQRTPWRQALAHVASTKQLICSQAHDLAADLEDLHFFHGRFPGLVSPGDMYNLLIPEAA